MMPLLALIPFLPVLAAVGAGAVGLGVYLLTRRSSPGAVGLMPGGMITTARVELATARPTILTARPSMTQAKVVLSQAAADEGLPTVSVENGWQPVWLSYAKAKNLKWGWCLNELMDARDRANIHEESKFIQGLMAAYGWASDYVAGIISAAFSGLSICIRMEIPATRLVWDQTKVWVVSRYPPLPPGVEDSIAGWSPDSSRQGWKATVGPFPASLGDPPADSLGAMWVKNLGDHYGWGDSYGMPVTIWHVVAWQEGATRYEHGTWKSSIAMSTSDWRNALIIQEPEWQDGDPVGPLGYFKAYAGEGQEWDWKISRRSKAEKVFR